jgi:membrane-bound serine protease (ClpP class)
VPFRTVDGWVYSEFTLSGIVRVTLLLAFLAQALTASSRAVEVDVDGVVHPITAEIVRGAIAQAREERASALIIRLNTPGGLMDAMRETIEAMFASPVPVVTYVAPSGGRAASAGFFLLEAGDVAAMAPGSNTGAAHPVAFMGQMDAVMTAKVENDAAAYIRGICAKRGRNSALAETAVRESKSFTEREALDGHLVELIAPNARALLAALDGRVVTRLDGSPATLRTAGAEIVVYNPSLRQRIISAIADPNIALVLLVIGALCIYVEFSTPGLIAPGVVGAILVLLGLSAISVLPVNWLGASLLVTSLVLFALEAKFTAHGALAVGGAVAMTLGAVMLIDSPLPELRIRWSTAISLAIPFSAITAVLLTIALRARRAKVETGAEGMIGARGTALTELAPDGKVFVHGEYWNAGAAAPIAAGSKIRVIQIQGLKLTVKPDDQTGG